MATTGEDLRAAVSSERHRLSKARGIASDPRCSIL